MSSPTVSEHRVISFDERPRQLIEDAIIPIPMKPGSPKKEHYEYLRNGTCCVFFWPLNLLTGKRLICVKECRTMVDYADLLDCLPISILNQRPSS